MAGKGINIDDIAAEFGDFVATKRKEIFMDFLALTNIDRYCTPIMGVQGIYEMAKAEISEISQPFQKAWTPKGTTAFKPSQIQMRRAKIDYELEPNEIYQGWLTFLATEGVAIEEWPISRWIVEKLTAKAIEERAKTAVDGVYAAPTPGTAGTRVSMFDGFLHILSDIETAASGNEIATGVMTTTPYDKIRTFMRSIAPEAFDACGRTVFMSKSLVDEIFDDYEDNNPNKTLKEIGGEDYGYIIPGTQGGKIIGLDGMGTSARVFTTPKWNMLKLSDQINEFGNIEVQKDKRQLNLLADYAVAYGFGFPDFVYHNDQA